MTIESKRVVEFGQKVTLYRVIAADGWSTLWHPTKQRALDHYNRRQAAVLSR